MDIEDITDEERSSDEEALAEAKEDEVREKVVEYLGIEDNDQNKDLIDKAVAREVELSGKLSKAVGQKIKYREIAKGGKKEQPPKPSSTSTKGLTPEEVAEQARKAAREEYEQRDLNSMAHSDKVKEQIKKVANLNNVSVLAAEKDPYIQSLIAEEKRQASVDDAAKNGKKRTVSGVTIDVSKPLDVTQFDLSTPEGRAEWEDAKKAKRDALK